MTAELDAYVKRKQIALARSVSGREKIYLDLNFWIRLREAASGTAQDSDAARLLERLRFGVESGRLICPLSDTTFLELMKQSAEGPTRLATARIMDELSLGLTLMRSDHRIGTEVYAFLLTALGHQEDLHPMQELVWTAIVHVCGPMHPTMPFLPPHQELELQKSFLDHLWTTSLSDMVRRFGDREEPPELFTHLSAETNRERDRHAQDIVSFKRAYEIELLGGLDACGSVVADVIGAHAEKNGYSPPVPGSPEGEETLRQFQNLLYLALTRKKDKHQLLRTLHISAALHAALRVDKPRRFKPNDFMDFQHAANALAYCDYFFTEGPLRELVSQKNLGFSALGCQVVSDFGAAIAAIEALLEPTSSDKG